VIDLRLRPHLQWLLAPIGRFLARMGLTPTVMTLVGLAITIFGAVLIATGRQRLGAVVALAGSVLDGLDGSVARATGSESAQGAFLDATSDRLGEVAIFAGLAVALAGNARLLLLIVLAMGAAMLIPYLRAKAEAEGIDGRGGLMGRAERVIILCGGLMLGWVEPMLWILAAATWFTVGQRFLGTHRALEAHHTVGS
jgi:CDP-diacylglycerol--glycerol-3-phosphate 3-phosphatidyltransferase